MRKSIFLWNTTLRFSQLISRCSLEKRKYGYSGPASCKAFMPNVIWRRSYHDFSVYLLHTWILQGNKSRFSASRTHYDMYPFRHVFLDGPILLMKTIRPNLITAKARRIPVPAKTIKRRKKTRKPAMQQTFRYGLCCLQFPRLRWAYWLAPEENADDTGPMLSVVLFDCLSVKS